MLEIIDLTTQFPIIASRTSHTRPLNKIKNLIIHHTASPRLSVRDLWILHTESKHNWSTFGYHFYYTKTGHLYKLNDINRIVNGAAGTNSTSVHLCFEGNFETDTANFEHAQVIDYIDKLLRSLKIITKIQGHYKFSKTLCPGQSLKKIINDMNFDRFAQLNLPFDDPSI